MTLTNEAGWPVYHTAPSANPDAGNYVLFLHGGGYINEIVRAHWRFVGYLTRDAHVRCVVPIYPLAPGATAKRSCRPRANCCGSFWKCRAGEGHGGRQFGGCRWGWRQPNGYGTPDIGNRTGWC